MRRTVGRVIGRVIGIIVLAVVLLFGGLLLFLALTEYRPQDRENLSVEGEGIGCPTRGVPLTVMTWNTGYGALGQNADFFMDGGKMVRTADEALVGGNMQAILEQIHTTDPDILFIQETDRASTRSHNMDELQFLKDGMQDYENSFAGNFKVAYLPYPIPPMGKVDSGIATFSRYVIDSAERIQLPIPFSWPIRMGNLKRCLLVSRIPLKDSDRELVLVNLHLEAYDDGEGKQAQTAMLKTLLEEEYAKGNYVIAGGDFNQVFSNVDMSDYPVYEGKWQPGEIDVSVFEEHWKFVMDNSTPSCRSLDQPYVGADLEHFQYYLIDGFIVSDNILIESAETLDLGFVVSDHNPVSMRIILQ